jgi:outer membrane protein OmpA-like peptidoglycan-associated protein
MKFDKFSGFFLRVFFVCAVFNTSWAQEAIQKNAQTQAIATAETQGQPYSIQKSVIPSASRITFYRPASASAPGVQTLRVNGHYLASLQAGGYVDLCLTPMRVELQAHYIETGKPAATRYAKAALELEVGKDTYVRVAQQAGAPDTLTPVAAAVALQELKDTRSQIHTISRVAGTVPCQVAETANPVVTAPPAPTVPTANATPVPQAQQVPKVKQTIRLDTDNYFEFGKSELSGMLPQSLQALSSAVAQMKTQLAQSSTGRIQVLGYSDPLGRPERKKIVASGRAQAIASYMVNQGIPPEKITSEGRGDAQSVVTHCDTRISKEAIACNKPNRRAVIQFLDVL